MLLIRHRRRMQPFVYVPDFPAWSALLGWRRAHKALSQFSAASLVPFIHSFNIYTWYLLFEIAKSSSSLKFAELNPLKVYVLVPDFEVRFGGLCSKHKIFTQKNKIFLTTGYLVSECHSPGPEQPRWSHGLFGLCGDKASPPPNESQKQKPFLQELSLFQPLSLIASPPFRGARLWCHLVVHHQRSEGVGAEMYNPFSSRNHRL